MSSPSGGAWAHGQREEWTHATLFVPGTPATPAAWARALHGVGLALSRDRLSGGDLPFSVGMEWIENDGSFGQAFSSGTCSAAEQRAIVEAPGAWVLYIPVDLHRERAAVVRLIWALAGCGALGVRVEESKLGYAVARWLALVDSEDPWSLYHAIFSRGTGRR